MRFPQITASRRISGVSFRWDRFSQHAPSAARLSWCSCRLGRPVPSATLPRCCARISSCRTEVPQW